MLNKLIISSHDLNIKKFMLKCERSHILFVKVYHRICTLRHIRIEINHGSQNVFLVLTWIGGYY
jgi:hypothetical protein